MQQEAITKAEELLAPLLERSKEADVLVERHDPFYNKMVFANNIIRQFIIDRGLIVYGGMTIDMALRLKGSSIYPDDLLPDYDFYSPENVEHSYELADILYNEGIKEARAINASHTGTMRVDVGDNHFMADISYVSQAIFDKIPFLVYNGVKILHPHMQRLDIHSSLAFPYDEAPNEVVFARWSKDIKRFNILDKFYPMDPTPPAQLTLRPVRSPLLSKYVLTGFAAYAAICEWYRAEYKLEPDVGARFKAEADYMEFDGLNSTAEFVHYEPKKAVRELGGQARYYENYSNILPATAQLEIDGVLYVIHDTTNRMVAVNTIRIGGRPIRVTNVQYVLKNMLGNYIINKAEPKLAATYLARYNSLMNMILAAQKKQAAVNTPLFPTTVVYGAENKSSVAEIGMNRLRHTLFGEPLFVVPMNYYSERARARGAPHPKFDPDSSPFYRDSGRQIDDNGLPISDSDK